MGTTAQKLQRVLDTKKGLKDTINTYLGQDITSAIPFKDYETYIKNFYNSLPKTSYAEGTEITLSNTLKGKLDFEDGIVGYGDTKQDSTTGIQLALLDQSINNRNTDITYTENVANSIVGSKTSNNGQFLATFVAQVVSGQSYIISGTATNCNLYAYKETLGGEPFANISSSTLPKSFTSDYTGTIVLGMFFPSAITGTASIKNFQLEKGSTAHNWENFTGGTPSPNPSYPQEIEVVRGKNIFNPSVSGLFAASCTVSLNGDEISINATQNGDIYVGNVRASGGSYEANRGVKIPVAPLTSYILSLTNSNVNKLFITEYDSNNISLGFVQSNTITTQANTSYITIRYGLENAVSGTTYKTNIQLEKGSQATSYLPYNTIEVKTSNGNLFYSSKADYNSSGLNVKFKDNHIILNGTTTALLDIRVLAPSPYSQNTFSLEILDKINSKNGSYVISNNSGLVCYFVTTNTSYKANTMNVTDNEKVSQIFIRVPNGTTFDNKDIEFQIENESVATSYQVHQETTQQLSLGEYEFAKIGNYVDTIEYDVENDKAYKNKAIEKIANKTNWTVGSIGTNNRAVVGLVANGYQNAVNSFSTANGLSNSFIGVSQSAIASTTQTNVIAINGDNIYIKFPDEINTKELAKAQLDSMTNLDFYYPLASALKEEITGTLATQIKALYNSQSFTGTTIITSNGQLPLVLKVRALKNG